MTEKNKIPQNDGKDFIILSMDASHICAVTAIEKVCFSTPWSRKSLEEQLLNPLSHFLVAVDEEVKGYIGVQEIAGEGYITNIAVLPGYRRKGIAQALLSKAMTAARERECSFITLEVRVSNTAAIALYTKNGFNIVGERRDFYTKPVENAYIMTRYF